MAAPVVTSNSPSAGRIAWTAFTIQYNGAAWPVNAGNSANKFVWWRWNAGAPVVEMGDAIPSTFDYVNDVLLFLNKAGVGASTYTTTVLDGSLIVSGSILTDAIGANQITSALIAANQVTATQIATDAVTAGKILAGSVTANKIAAGAITADKLGIGSYTSNLAVNPYFEELDPADNTWVTAWTRVTSAGYTGATYALETAAPISGAQSLKMTATAGNRALVYGKYQPVAENEDIYISAMVYSSVASTGTVGVGLWFYNKAFTYLSEDYDGGDVGLVEGYVQYIGTIPSTAAYAVPVLLTTSTNPTYWDQVEMGHRITTVRIADGAVTAQQVKAHTITGNEILAQSISASEIAANTITANQLAANTITANEIDSNYAYVGEITADQILTGVLGAEVAIAGKILTPNAVGGGHVEMNPGGITIFGPNDPSDTTTLQPGQSTFKGQAEVSNITVKGNADATGGITLRSTGNEISRTAKVTMSNQVTTPGQAPGYVVDWVKVPLTGYSWSGSKVMDMTWDATNSRWIMFVDGYDEYVFPMTFQSRQLAFRADGTYDNTLTQTLGGKLSGLPGNSGVCGCRINATTCAWIYNQSGNYRLRYSTGVQEMAFIGEYNDPTNTLGVPRAMTYDGTNICVIHQYLGGSSSWFYVNKYTTSAVAGANIVPNGQFETDVSGWTGVNVGTLTWSATTPIVGTHSLQWFTSNTGLTGTVTSNRFAVTQKMRYEWQFRARMNIAQTLTCKALWYDSSNVLLKTDTLIAYAHGGGGLPYLVSSSGNYFSATAPLAATQVALQFSMPCINTNMVQLDDITMNTSAGLNWLSVASLTLGTAMPSSPTGVYVGSGDFGATNYVIPCGSGENIFTIPDATKAVSTSTFIAPPITPVAIGYDGTNFWTLGSDFALYKHEAGAGNKLTAPYATWWAGYAWRDATHETALSPPTQLTMKNRARLTISTAPLPIAGSGDPTAIGIYLSNKATVPTVGTDWHLNGTPAVNSLVITNAVQTGANPVPNAFPAGSPGLFQSAAVDGSSNPYISLQGDGSGRVGPLSWNAAGAVLTTPVPTGCIMMWYTNTPPTGWLLMNGQSTSGYPALAAIVGATVPDMRNYFPMGAGLVAANTTGGQANLPSHTHGTSHTHTQASHQHTFNVQWSVNTTATGAVFRVTDVANATGGGGSGSGTATTVGSGQLATNTPVPAVTDPTGSGGTADENRPPFRALYFIIKT